MPSCRFNTINNTHDQRCYDNDADPVVIASAYPIESGLPSVDAAKCQMSNQKRNSVVLLTSTKAGIKFEYDNATKIHYPLILNDFPTPQGNVNITSIFP